MNLPLGGASLALPDCEVTVAEPPGGTAVGARAAAVRALDDPHGPAVSALADPDDEVAIAVTDATRPTPDDVLVDLLLDRLPVPELRVSVVVGVGNRRRATDAERRAGLGRRAGLATNPDPGAAVEVGRVDGASVTVAPAVAAADLVIATGTVDPHAYAGFSGGARTLVPGAGGRSLRRRVRASETLSRPSVRPGRIADNPVRDAIDRAGDAAGLDFCLNLVRGPTAGDDRRAAVLGASAGRPRAVVRDLAAVVRAARPSRVGVGDASDGFDAVIAGVGAPRDATLFRATRAATRVVRSDAVPLRTGGRVILAARLSEGVGAGRAGRRFRERLRDAESAGALRRERRDERYDRVTTARPLSRARCATTRWSWSVASARTRSSGTRCTRPRRSATRSNREVACS